MKEMISFRDRRLYPVFFMVILSAVLTFILAFSYQLSKDRVMKYKELKLQTNLLDLFVNQIPELATIDINNADEINILYNKYLVEKTLKENSELNYYEFIEEGKAAGYVFNVSAKGLWSTIKLLVAVEPDFSQYLGIKITSQGETPGLGARITEDWFQKQFSGKPFHQENKFIQLKLIEEGEQQKADQISQITGATISSQAVVSGIQKELESLYRLDFSQGKGE